MALHEHQAVSVALDWKPVRAAEVDMPVADRSNAAQGIDGIPGRGTLTFTLNGALTLVIERRIGSSCVLAALGTT
jgi:hypothetical protein